MDRYDAKNRKREAVATLAELARFGAPMSEGHGGQYHQQNMNAVIRDTVRAHVGNTMLSPLRRPAPDPFIILKPQTGCGTLIHIAQAKRCPRAGTAVPSDRQCSTLLQRFPSKMLP